MGLHHWLFGHKDQVELALQILRSSAVLKRMRIDSRVIILHECAGEMIEVYSKRHVLDGRMIAMDLFCGADHGDIVEVVGAYNVVPEPSIRPLGE